MKLGGWQRIGIIASVLWALGAGIAERVSQVDHSYHYFTVSMDTICPMARKSAGSTAMSSDILVGQQAGSDAYTRCLSSAHRTAEEMRSWESLNGQAGVAILAVGILPVIAGWVLAYLGRRLFFWVKAGFKA